MPNPNQWLGLLKMLHISGNRPPNVKQSRSSFALACQLLLLVHLVLPQKSQNVFCTLSVSKFQTVFLQIIPSCLKLSRLFPVD